MYIQDAEMVTIPGCSYMYQLLYMGYQFNKLILTFIPIIRVFLLAPVVKKVNSDTHWIKINLYPVDSAIQPFELGPDVLSSFIKAIAHYVYF